MYNQTLHAVNEYNPDLCVRFLPSSRLQLTHTSVPAHLSNEVRCRLINTLDSWHFEPHKLLDDEVLACTLILFEALLRIEGMEETVGISMSECNHIIKSNAQVFYLRTTRTTIRFCSPSPPNIQIPEYLPQF